MATSSSESFIIPVQFTASGTGFSIPETVTVPLNAKVQWIITDEQVSRSSREYRNGLIFRLYFERGSPFKWDTQNTTVFYPPPPSGRTALQYQPIAQALAEGQTEEKGDFKYGVRAIDNSSGVVIFEEDPRLIVY